MTQFTLAGENGRLRVALENCPAGSLSCRATVEIEVPGYRAEGKVWLSRAALAAFASELRACDQSLDGAARLTSDQESLSLTVTYQRRSGRVEVTGAYRQTMVLANELRFGMLTDQSYMAESLLQVEQCVSSLL